MPSATFLPQGGRLSLSVDRSRWCAGIAGLPYIWRALASNAVANGDADSLLLLCDPFIKKGSKDPIFSRD